MVQGIAVAFETILLLQTLKGWIYVTITAILSYFLTRSRVKPGYRVIDRAKIIETRPDIKVLYMSGYTDHVIIHHGVLM